MIVQETKCQYCQQSFSYSPRPQGGRPPKTCLTCRETRKEGGVTAVRERIAALPTGSAPRLTELAASHLDAEVAKRERANRRVDNLELMLRANGSYLQQHLNKENEVRVPIGYYSQGRKTAEDDWITDYRTSIPRNSMEYNRIQEAMEARNNDAGFVKFRLR